MVRLFIRLKFQLLIILLLMSNFSVVAEKTEINSLRIACDSISKIPTSKKLRKRLKAYLLPKEHPAQVILSQIFSENRVLASMKSLKKAGFNASKPRKFTKLIVATHPRLPDYFFKLYLDNQRYYKEMPEYEQWMLRIEGANLIREEIQKRGCSHLFKVPQKWIYLLPREPACAPEFIEKFTILIEENMNLISSARNHERWKSDHISYELLSTVFFLVKDLGLHDCLKPDNAPFSSDGRVAFIDTQSYRVSVELKRFTKFISIDNKKIWNELIDQNK